MPRVSILQTFTVVALFVACVFVANHVAKYLLKVDGGYRQWSVFTDCSKSCGGGMRMRRRKCNNPVPKFGGENCSQLGSNIQVLGCNRNPCPINGRYGSWLDYEACSLTCGGGVQVRRRKCDNPAPQYGGKNCKEMELGPDEETRRCNEKKCPVNGDYSIWSDFGKCSKSCGGGVKGRDRTCTNPAPSEGGKDCSKLGPSHETASCNTDPCPTQPPTTESTTEPTTKPTTKPTTLQPETTPEPTELLSTTSSPDTTQKETEQPTTKSASDTTKKTTESSSTSKAEQSGSTVGSTTKSSEEMQPTEKPKQQLSTTASAELADKSHN